MLKNKWFYIFVFIFVLVLSFLMPISGDDWNNYLVGSLGLRHMVGQAIGMYFDWEGRIVSRLLINFLTYYKIIFDFALAFLVMIGLYFINHFIPVKNSKVFLLLSLGIFLFLDNPMFTQTILWVAGSITYLFPTILILGYVFFYFRFLEGKSNYAKWIYFASSIFSFLIPMFVENIAIAYVVLNLCFLIYEIIRYKKINGLLVINLLFSIVGTILMLLSPGSQKRSMLEVEFNSMSFWSKVTYNYGNFIYYTIVSNFYLILLMSISSIYLVRRIFKNKVATCLSALFTVGIPILLCVKGYTNQFYEQIYWTIYFIYIVILTVLVYKRDFDKLKVLLPLIITAISSTFVLVITPGFSSRVAVFCVIFLSISYLYVLDDLFFVHISHIEYSMLVILVSFACVLYGVAYFNLYRFNIFLEKSIEQDILENQAEITVYEVPSYLAWGLTPTGDYHIKTFKEYYKISDTQKLVYRKSVWNYFIFFDEKNTLLKN